MNCKRGPCFQETHNLVKQMSTQTILCILLSEMYVQVYGLKKHKTGEKQHHLGRVWENFRAEIVSGLKLYSEHTEICLSKSIPKLEDAFSVMLLFEYN